MKKFISIVTMAIIVLSLMAGCSHGGANDSVITLKVWEDENNIEMLKPLADEFITDYAKNYPKAPTLKITFEPQTEGSAIENVGLYGAAGTAADVVAFIHDSLGKAVIAGDIAKVPNQEYIKENYTNEAFLAFSENDVLYGYPNVAESITLMYDKTKATSAQLSSFESIKAAGKKIALKTTSDAYYMFAFLNDANLFGENGKDKTSLNLSSDKAADNLYSFVSNYKDNVADLQPEEAVALLQSGEIAGIVSAPFLWPTVKKALGDNAAVISLPTINGNQLNPFTGYKGYAVSSYTKYPHLAHAFAAYLTNSESQYYRFVQKQLLPTVSDTSRIDEAINKDKTGKYDYVNCFRTSLENGVVMPNILAMGNYWAPAQDTLTAIWNLSGDKLSKANIKSELTKLTDAIKALVG